MACAVAIGTNNTLLLKIAIKWKTGVEQYMNKLKKPSNLKRPETVSDTLLMPYVNWKQLEN